MGQARPRLPALGWEPDTRRPVPERFRQALTLREAQLEVVGASTGPDAGLALFLRLPSGYCVVNSWGAGLEGNVELSLVSTWVSPGGQHALLLLRMAVAAEPPVRWLVLATDGQRLWHAARRAGSAHLRVARAQLDTHGSEPRLALTERTTTLLAFDPRTGVFGP